MISRPVVSSSNEFLTKLGLPMIILMEMVWTCSIFVHIVFDRNGDYISPV